jgi:hypothetical protein
MVFMGSENPWNYLVHSHTGANGTWEFDFNINDAIITATVEPSPQAISQFARGLRITTSENPANPDYEIHDFIVTRR